MDGARLLGAPFCIPKGSRLETAMPAKRKRGRVTSGGKQGPSVARRGRCVGRSSARCKSRRGLQGGRAAHTLT